MTAHKQKQTSKSITNKKREQVVELLRCAADCRYGVNKTALLIGASDRTKQLAQRAFCESPFGVP